MTAAATGLVALLVLVFARVPIAVALAVTGFVGFALLTDWQPALALAAHTAKEGSLNFGLAVVPLFVLMGNFITRARLSEGMFNAAYAFLGHKKGGLALASVAACSGFSAVCGSSLATAATMAKVAIPSMRRFGYDDRLATGSIAAGGTLGILIPPSVMLLVYGIITDTHIGKLFAAGVIPGILGILLYMGAVRYTTWRDPKQGPPEKELHGLNAYGLWARSGVSWCFLPSSWAVFTREFLLPLKQLVSVRDFLSYLLCRAASSLGASFTKS